MNLTVDHLTQTVYQEFSKRKINKFTMIELARIAQLSRSTIYYYFEDMNQIYKSVFNNIVLADITRNCQSSDDFLERTINYIALHKTFCLNLYYKTALVRSNQHAINLLDEQLSRFDQGSNNYNAIAIYICTIDDWFKDDLARDKSQILNDLKTI